MQISDQLSVIGFFWWHHYRISVHAKKSISTPLVMATLCSCDLQGANDEIFLELFEDEYWMHQVCFL